MIIVDGTKKKKIQKILKSGDKPFFAPKESQKMIFIIFLIQMNNVKPTINNVKKIFVLRLLSLIAQLVNYPSEILHLLHQQEKQPLLLTPLRNYLLKETYNHQLNLLADFLLDNQPPNHVLIILID